MSSVRALKSLLFKTLAGPMRDRAYTKKRGDLFFKPTQYGYYGTRFPTKDYVHMESHVEFCVRHSAVNDVYELVIERSGGWPGWSGKALDDLKKQMKEAETFMMSWNGLVGRQEHSGLAISEESEVPELCNRLLERHDETAHAFFSQFTSLSAIADMYELDDPFLWKLYYGDKHAVAYNGLVSLYACGRIQAAKYYVDRHAKLFTGTNRSYADILLKDSIHT